MKPNSTLLGMIEERATATFGKPPPRVRVSIDEWNEWIEHFAKSADELAEQFDAQGLPKTAESIRAHAEYARKSFVRNSDLINPTDTNHLDKDA